MNRSLRVVLVLLSLTWIGCPNHDPPTSTPAPAEITEEVRPDDPPAVEPRADTGRTLHYEGKTYRWGDRIRFAGEQVSPIVATVAEVETDSLTLRDRAEVREHFGVLREIRVLGDLVVRDGSRIPVLPNVSDSLATLNFSLKSTSPDAVELSVSVSLSSAWHLQEQPQQLGETRELELIEQDLAASEASKRKAAVRELGGHVSQAAERVAQLLGEALQDPEPDVRAAAAQIVPSTKQAGLPLLPALLQRIQEDTDERVRLHAVRTVQAWTDSREQSLPAVRHALQADDSLAVRAAAAIALGRLSLDQQEKDPLLEALKHPQHQVSQAAAMGLSIMGAVPELIACMDDERWWVREQAIHAFKRKPMEFAEPALESLTKALSDDYWKNRQAVLAVLANLGSGAQSALPALERRLAEESDSGLKAALPGVIAKIKR